MYVFNDRTNLDDAIAKLKEKGVTLPCPRCGKLKFSIVGETDIAILTIVRKDSAVPSMPSSIPAIIIGCDNCGNLFHHAKGPLGLSSESRRF